MTRARTSLGEHWLLLLRLVLAVLVLLSHSVTIAYGVAATTGREWGMRLTHGQMTGGDVAVAAFFILSGFLVTSSWLRDQHLRRYASRRWRRIFPGFAGAYLFSAFLVPMLADPTGLGVRTALTAENPLTHLFLMGTFHVPQAAAFAHLPVAMAVNASSWTLPYEAWCYAFVPFLAVLGVLRRRSRAVVFFAGALALTMIGLKSSAGIPALY